MSAMNSQCRRMDASVVPLSWESDTEFSDSIITTDASARQNFEVNMLQAEEWTHGEVIATLTAPCNEESAIDHCVVQGRQYSVTEKYTVVLRNSAPVVILKDQQLLYSVGRVSGEYGLGRSRLPYIWASVLWTIWPKMQSHVDTQEHIRVAVFLNKICTAACDKLLKLPCATLNFNLIVIGSMKRWCGVQGRMAYLVTDTTEGFEITSIQLSNVLVGEAAPFVRLTFTNSFLESTPHFQRVPIVVPIQRSLAEVNERGIYFRHHDAVPAGRIMNVR